MSAKVGHGNDKQREPRRREWQKSRERVENKERTIDWFYMSRREIKEHSRCGCVRVGFCFQGTICATVVKEAHGIDHVGDTRS